ncbi:hypothetical protein GON01_08240 [Sphingomonas sp. MAH-20]|uniref:Phage gp6-like head-tail connector protein n=1 Tax=Sphingomonas horti TaxID=2682842 RepID=A0A6I4J3L3_9SPHN|nr:MULTISPECIES: hypothetical protein [Sphingomonas]MBA2920041.1 hypothetical protein [Sphingomonas sp. CGMCC 1.13658]MVO77921.1 hypothetical protein [Sphingomonas horti]
MVGFADADLAAAREAAKRYARVEQAGEDALIGDLAATCLLLCEAFCGRIGLAREAVEILPASAEWSRLAAGPVRSITAVEGIPAEGAAFTLPVESYAIDIDAEGSGWVRVTTPGAAGRVRVTYLAGLADDWDRLPEPLRQGVVRLTTHLFAHRDDAREGAPPAAVAALWRPWRRVSLGEPTGRSGGPFR